jgi:Tfp pilus tip-associated adhesin PilY1
MYGSPALAYDKLGSLWVFVGTGDRNHPKDASSNSAYGIKDNTDMTNGAALTESDLVDATGADPAVQGWYLGFAPDEKALGAAKVYNSIVYFSTYTPISTDPCADGDSVARLYAVQLDSGDAGIDFATGEKLTSGGGGGMGVKPRMTDIGGGIGSDPQISVGDSTDTVVVGTTDQELTEITLPGSATKNLRYWREVY